jgi:hypothetical protein
MGTFTVFATIPSEIAQTLRLAFGMTWTEVQA